MGNYLSIRFWFDMRPGQLNEQILQILVVIVGAFVVFTIFLTIFKKRYQKGLYGKILKSSYVFFTTNSIIGFLLLFFTYELIPFLSSRFWFLLWGLSMLVWIGFIIKITFSIPKRKKELEQEKEFKKYIPQGSK